MLAVKDLEVEFGSAPNPAVRGVTVQVRPGEVVAVVGESGSGKSVTALAAMGLLPVGARVTRGTIEVDGKVVPGGGRGRGLAMIFQEPMSSLNQSMTVGEQIAEAVTIHQGLRGKVAWSAAVRALEEVGIAEAGRRAAQYPHEFSGGMCQRVMIAIALACRPRYLIADEPTTALDATVQAGILDLIVGRVRGASVESSARLGVMLITHDLGIVAERADSVVVMHAGRVMEHGPAWAVLGSPRHPYTVALLACAPKLEPGGARRDRLPTVADTIGSETLRIRTADGERRAYWLPQAAAGVRAELVRDESGIRCVAVEASAVETR
jgi:ABC-type dipeptide/oligopeptide/nickel transport system ATPase component